MGIENMKKLSKPLYVLVFLLVFASLFLVSCTWFQEEDVPPGDLTGRVYLDENANAECEECDCDFYLEGIVIQLFVDRCAGLVRQTVETDEDGIFIFTDLEPGLYCVMPKVKLICEGYQPTTPITQRVEVLSSQVVEAPWFGFDHYTDVND